MSSYLVDKDIYQKVANTLHTMTKHSINRFPTVTKFFKDIDIREFINSVVQMNCKAVSVRYDTNLEKQFFIDRPSLTTLDRNEILQVIKYLHSIRYQCSEGLIVETETYKDLCILIDDLQHDYITSIPEYDDLVWA